MKEMERLTYECERMTIEMEELNRQKDVYAGRLTEIEDIMEELRKE
jgi:hypothetical protein